MIREFVNNVNADQDSWFASDPYYFLRIDALDHGENGIRQYSLSGFEADNTTQKSSRQGDSWIKLKDNVADTEISFTKNIYIYSDDYYLIEVYVRKNQKVKSNNFDLSIDGNSIWEESGYNKWDDYGQVIRLPIQYLETGNKSFVLTVPKYAWGGWLKISRVDRYEGGKDLVENSENRLDLINTSFTQNGVSQIDTMEVTIAMKPDYWTDTIGDNPLAFTLGDHVTFVLGEDMQSSRPMFGGYISGWKLNSDQTELTLSVVDRLWDLQRTLIKKNFYIGSIKNLVQPAYQSFTSRKEMKSNIAENDYDIVTSSYSNKKYWITTWTLDTSSGFPYTQFKNVNEIARYLCTSRYALDFDAITREYILYNSFSEGSDVTQLSTIGMDLSWETEFGNPGTCMRMIPSAPGDNEVILYNDPDGANWDAKDYDVFSFSYYASGAGVKYPVKFNIEIDMFKEGETSASKRTYYIVFNGDSPSNNKYLLTTKSAKLNGDWQEVTLNLSDLFDAKSPSDEYNITQIRFNGVQENSTVRNRRCSSIYIDQVMGFRNIVQAPTYKSADSKTAFEELQDLCEDCNQVAYIRPGMSRDEDQLIMIPKRYYNLPILLESGNVREVSNLEFQPISWGVFNSYTGTWSKQGKTSTTSKTISKSETEHMKHYGIIEERESMSDIISSSDASKIATNRILEGVNMDMAFDVTMNGSTLIEPGQYISVNLPEYHINGVYEISSIVHEIDFINEDFTTQLDFTRPSGKFSKMMQRLQRAMFTLQNIQMNNTYETTGSLAAGLDTSTGAYS